MDLAGVQEEIQNIGYDEVSLKAEKNFLAELHNTIGKEEMF